jgi:GTPase SAR1 family protein
MSLQKYSLVVMGGGGVGKSAITLSFMRNQYDPDDAICFNVQICGRVRSRLISHFPTPKTLNA